MRIVVLGDYHIKRNNLEITEKAMEDVIGAAPDLVIPLGDFGSNDVIGSVEGLRQAKEFLSPIEAPMRPILGNHDLQRESGPGKQEKGTMEQALREMYQLSASYGVIEHDAYRLLFISTEVQSEEDCYQIQECFTSDEQFQWIVDKLEERPNTPCIVFSHAPPIGCGLKTVPGVHVRSTNAYLDQNHKPHKWFEAYKKYPQIVMWFSAHYHLGHHHPDSHSNRYGTHFFITGVHAEVTRDGQRQSRVIDIEDSFIKVSTLDHAHRALNATPDWDYIGPLQALMEDKKEILAQLLAQPLAQPEQKDEESGSPASHTQVDEGSGSPTLAGQVEGKSGSLVSHTQVDEGTGWHCMATVPVGMAGSAIKAVFHIHEQRCLLQSEDGFLWECDIETSSILGTIQYASSEPLRVVAFDHNRRYIWTAVGSQLSRIDLHSPWRFVRDLKKRSEKEKLAHTDFLELNADDPDLQVLTDSDIQAAASDQTIYEIQGTDGEVKRRRYSIIAPTSQEEQSILQIWEQRGR